MDVLTAHMWAGAVGMGVFSAVFLNSYLTGKRKDTNGKLIKGVVLITNLISMFSFLIMGFTRTLGQPDISIDTTRYITWFVTTPLLLISIALVEKLPVHSILFITAFDELGMACAYIAYVATHPAVIWTFFSIGIILITGVGYYLYEHYPHIKHRRRRITIDLATYHTLCIVTGSLWLVYPILFSLAKYGVLPYTVEQSLYVYLDFLSKGLFGLFLVGSRDLIERARNPMVRFADTVIHIYKVDTEEEIVTDTSGDTAILIGSPDDSGTFELSDSTPAPLAKPHSFASQKSTQVMPLPIPHKEGRPQ